MEEPKFELIQVGVLSGHSLDLLATIDEDACVRYYVVQNEVRKQVQVEDAKAIAAILQARFADDLETRMRGLELRLEEIDSTLGRRDR